jgi:hypothetical protein
MAISIKNKEDRINKLVEYLLQKYGSDSFVIKDYWDADRCAIGFTDISEQYLFYISIYNLDEGRYFVVLENLSKDSDLFYEAAGEFNNVQLIEVESIFTKHLRIN